MNQQPRALDVTQELCPETGARVRPFDQPRDIGHKETDLVRIAVLAHHDHPEIRLKSGEWVIRNFRSRRRNAGNQSGLTDIRISHQSNIGQKLQLQAKRTLLAGTAWLTFTRRLVSGRCKPRIAPS